MQEEERSADRGGRHKKKAGIRGKEGLSSRLSGRVGRWVSLS